MAAGVGAARLSLREKFAHTGQVQTRHNAKGGIFQHPDGRLVFWLYDVLENMDGTPDWQQPYLWYRKLGFDIPAGEKRMLRELYASVFGGPCDSSTSLQHFGRAPACAAEAEHTLLVNRIHNTKDTRWSKHGAYNDDSSGAKKARLTEDAVWRPEWGVPNWGILLPDHWTGEVDRTAGRRPTGSGQPQAQGEQRQAPAQGSTGSGLRTPSYHLTPPQGGLSQTWPPQDTTMVGPQDTSMAEPQETPPPNQEGDGGNNNPPPAAEETAAGDLSSDSASTPRVIRKGEQDSAATGGEPTEQDATGGAPEGPTDGPSGPKEEAKQEEAAGATVTEEGHAAPVTQEAAGGMETPQGVPPSATGSQSHPPEQEGEAQRTRGTSDCPSPDATHRGPGAL